MKKNFFIIVFFSGVIFTLLFFMYVYLFPMNKQKVVVELSAGDRLSLVANKLYDKGVVNSKFIFKLWMYLTWNQNNLKFGEYEIPSNATLSQIKDIITSGRMYNKYVTIPEGLTLKQIYEIFIR